MFNVKRLAPVVTGIFLGAVSIIIGQVPTAVAQFSGMTVIGNQTGYLLAVLILAWVYFKRWRDSFWAGVIAMTFANLTYYLSILAFYIFKIGRSPFPPTPLQTLFSFTLWTVISTVVCVLAATAVLLAYQNKHKIIKYGIFAVSYIGLLGVIYFIQVRFLINWYNQTINNNGFVQTWRLAGFLFEIGFAFVMSTLVICIGFKKILSQTADIK